MIIGSLRLPYFFSYMTHDCISFYQILSYLVLADTISLCCCVSYDFCRTIYRNMLLRTFIVVLWLVENSQPWPSRQPFHMVIFVIHALVKNITHRLLYLLIKDILGGPPSQDSSHHQDYYLFFWESQPEPSFPLLLGGGTTQRISHMLY